MKSLHRQSDEENTKVENRTYAKVRALANEVKELHPVLDQLQREDVSFITIRRRGSRILRKIAERPATDTLVVGTLAEPVSLEPHRATDLVGATIELNAGSNQLARQPRQLGLVFAVEGYGREWKATIARHQGLVVPREVAVGCQRCHIGDEGEARECPFQVTLLPLQAPSTPAVDVHAAVVKYCAVQ